MWIIKHRKIFYSFSAIIILASLASLLVWGLKFGIDFTGGSLLEVSYESNVPAVAEVTAALKDSGITNASIRPTGDSGYLVRTPFLSPDEHSRVKDTLAFGGTRVFEEKRFDSIGPSIGSELSTRALYAIFTVLFAITLFIAFAFRKVSNPAGPEQGRGVSSWKYGLVALAALAHDVIVPTGVFAILGAFFGAEVDTLFVTALLVVLGFSVHDTIVVFDRVRENLRKNQEQNAKEPFEEVVGRSVTQTMARSINTSLTTVFVLATLYFLGPESIRWFSLTLIIGIVAGTYSSIFLGSPLLVSWQGNKAEQKKRPVF